MKRLFFLLAAAALILSGCASMRLTPEEKAMIERQVQENLDGGVIGTILAVIVFISSVSISVRRLHDCGHSGLWVLLYLIPLVNLILLIYLCVKPGK